jgi:hypothetical protein
VAEGQPFPSPFTGTVVALWIAPGMTVGSLFPVLELMVDETPLEVLGLVPAGERAALKSAEPQGSVRRHETPIASQIKAVTGVEVGGATLQPSDIALLFPGVPVTGPSAVVRVQLAAKAAPEDVGRVVRFRLGAGRRPRLWTWLSSR